MSILAQGTNIYFIDPEDCSVVQVECATSFNPGGAPADQIDVTCLEDQEREFRRGLRTPGQAQMGLNADPNSPSHVRLHELSEDAGQEVLHWAVGWSDGTAAPTADSDCAFVLPESRTWFTFDGYVADFPFDFQLNTVVTTTVSIQRSGGSAWVPKVISSGA